MPLLLLACASDPAEPAPEVDAEVDAATSEPDAAPPEPDAAPPEPDATPPEPDAALPAILRLNEIDCRGPDSVELFALEGGPLEGWALHHLGRETPLEGRMESGEFRLLELGDDLRCEAPIELRGPAPDEATAPYDLASVTWGRLPDGEGEWQPTQPTPGAANEAPRAPGVELFGDTPIELSITLGEQGHAALAQSREAVVDATLHIGLETYPMRLQVVGQAGRFTRIDQKPTLDLEFIEPMRGLRGLRLDGTRLDPGFLTRKLAHEMLRAMGLPAARVGFAHLTLDGVDYGAYLLIEPHDAVFAAQHFVSSWHVYEATSADFQPDHLDRFGVGFGPAGDRRDLRALIAALEAEEGLPAHALDPRFAASLGAELALGAAEGYLQRVRSDWHFDQRARAALLPAAMDLALRLPVTPDRATSHLFRRCIADADCNAGLLVSADLEDFRPRLQALAAIARPLLETDTRTLYSTEMMDVEVARMDAFLAGYAARLELLRACLAGQDDDGDGVPCFADCDPEDGGVAPGIEEICGDGVDQDCSGAADDGHCRGCLVRSRGGHDYQFCASPLSYAEAEAHCATQGQSLVRIDSAAESVWLARTGRAIRGGAWWIGFQDREEEGTFVWPDGPGDFTNWNGNEPNDSGGEDCTELRNNGRWNDLACAQERPFICEPACVPEDADGDGSPTCGADCDDADPERGPLLEDLCDDGLDQDCSGAADEACGVCPTAERDGQRYLICPQNRNFEAARAFCEEQGGHLAIVDDAEENAWLFETAIRLGGPKRYWLGISDLEEEWIYRWVDGSRPRFTAWSRGEPNDSGRNEDCGHFWENRPQWNDIRCNAGMGTLCELR